MAKPIPDGYHSLTPFLNVKGAAKAIEFYQKAFGAEERGRMNGPTGSIIHAEIKIGDSIVMLAEAETESPTVSSTHLYTKDTDAAFKRAIDAGCEVKMPPMNMFWGDRYARVTDPFGNRWGIATHIEDVPENQMKSRMDEFMKQFPRK